MLCMGTQYGDAPHRVRVSFDGPDAMQSIAIARSHAEHGNERFGSVLRSLLFTFALYFCSSLSALRFRGIGARAGVSYTAISAANALRLCATSRRTPKRAHRWKKSPPRRG